MGNAAFPILGTGYQPMLGRTKVMKRVWDDLTKPTPSNLSLVGPRFIGKTVLVNAIAKHAASVASPYSFLIIWALGHVSPQSDEAFVAQLANLLGDELASRGAAYTEHREILASHFFADLKDVTDGLNKDGKHILMIWDGFDKPLTQGKLSGHLFDQMRTIFDKTKHKIVTTTRRPLRELLFRNDVYSSQFWNIFDPTPVRLGVFDDRDCEAVLAERPELTFSPGAKTELLNWSGGFPLFVLEIVNVIMSESPRGLVDNKVVKQAAERATERMAEVLSAIWDDCPVEARDLYADLLGRGEISVESVGKGEETCLIEKGFARLSGKNLTPACRMLQDHIRDVAPDIGRIARLFGNWEAYKSNIRYLLERRLGQMKCFDERLQLLVAGAIENIPKFPDDCLNNLTNIEERALDLIWQREFGQEKAIPKEIVEYWERVCPSDRIVQRLKERIGNSVPADRGLQCGILQLLTGSRKDFESKAKYISKNTYVLINAIHSFRNRSQHSDGQSMHVGVAVAAIMGCVELLACLEQELTSA